MDIEAWGSVDAKYLVVNEARRNQGRDVVAATVLVDPKLVGKSIEDSLSGHGLRGDALDNPHKAGPGAVEGQRG